MKEIWKDIPKYEGYYQVSNMGRIKSIERIVKTPNHKFTRSKIIKSRILKPQSQKSGHVFVGLSKKGKTKLYRVHSLVLETFLGKRSKGQQTRHLNGIPNDNRLANLKYGTQLENSRDAILHEAIPFGEKHYRSKLSSRQVALIIKLRGELSSREAAEIFSVQARQIRRIWDGTRRARG